VNSNANWSVVGPTWRIEVTYAGIINEVGWRVGSTDPGNTGSYVKNLHWFRASDETDFNAGLIYRQGYKQAWVTLNPGLLRFMNWTGANGSNSMRFENRTKTATLTGSGGNFVPGSKYTAEINPCGAITNQFCLSAAVDTPVSMQNGEIVQTRIGSTGMVRAGGTLPVINNITQANPAVVTTAAAHSLQIGDRVQLILLSTSGMQEIDHRVATISAVTGTTFTTDIDASAFSAFQVVTIKTGTTAAGVAATSNMGTTTGIVPGSNGGFPLSTVTGSTLAAGETVNSCSNTQCIISTGVGVTTGTGITFTFTTQNTGTVYEYASLNVGSRGEFPITVPDGSTPTTINGNIFFAANTYKALFFDKNSTALKDTSGNPVYGAWLLTPNQGTTAPLGDGMSLELSVALVNEINTQSRAQGITAPVNMWVTIPHLGLLSIDPDYSQSSSYAIGSVSTILNGGGGYAGLYSGASLFVEYSNETWNPAFYQSAYMARQGNLNSSLNGNGNSYWTALRSTVMVNDIKAALGASSRIKFVLSGQGTVGIASGSTNYNRAFGTVSYFTDPRITSLPTVAKTGNIVSASCTISSIASTTNLYVGMGVSNANLPAGSQVASKTSSSVTISSPCATGNSTGASLSFLQSPMYYHDAWAWAAYFLAGTQYDSANLATLTAQYVADIGNPTAQEADAASYVTGGVGVPGSVFTGVGGNSETVNTYQNTHLPAYATAMAAIDTGRGTFMYEGGWDKDTGPTIPSFTSFQGTLTSGSPTVTNLVSSPSIPNGTWIVNYQGGLPDFVKVTGSTSTTLTLNANATASVTNAALLAYTDTNLYLRGVKRSQSWANALTTFYNAFSGYSNAFFPADYLRTSSRWGHVYQDSYVNGVENAGFDKAWQDIGTRNRALFPFLLKRDIDPASNDNDPMWLEKAA
jgi:hypothetical protein